MSTVYLIKHGAPQIRAGVPAHDWTLSEEGRAGALALAERLKPRALSLVVTSQEDKAIATGRILADALALPLRHGLGLHEHLRYTQPWYGKREEFDRAVAALFARPSERVFGEESADEAHDRFAEAVRVAVQFASGDIALVAHGTVISLLVARANRIDPLPLWKQLDFCDFYAVRASDFSLLSQTSLREEKAS